MSDRKLGNATDNAQGQSCHSEGSRLATVVDQQELHESQQQLLQNPVPGKEPLTVIWRGTGWGEGLLGVLQSEELNRSQSRTLAAKVTKRTGYWEVGRKPPLGLSTLEHVVQRDCAISVFGGI